MGYRGKYFWGKDGKLYRCFAEFIDNGVVTDMRFFCHDDGTVKYLTVNEFEDFMTLAEGEYFHVAEENIQKLREVIIPRGDPCVLNIDAETKICLQILLDNQRIEIGDYFYPYSWKGGWVKD